MPDRVRHDKKLSFPASLFAQKKSPSAQQRSHLRIYLLLSRTPAGRSSGSRILLQTAPSRPACENYSHEPVVLIAVFVPDHSGGSAPESHRFPCSVIKHHPATDQSELSNIRTIRQCQERQSGFLRISRIPLRRPRSRHDWHGAGSMGHGQKRYMPCAYSIFSGSGLRPRCELAEICAQHRSFAPGNISHTRDAMRHALCPYAGCRLPATDHCHLPHVTSLMLHAICPMPVFTRAHAGRCRGGGHVCDRVLRSCRPAVCARPAGCRWLLRFEIKNRFRGR